MKSSRLGYIDALKGGLIFFVLLSHFLYFSIGIEGSFLGNVFELTAMPTFFLISGYLYKDKQISEMKELSSRLAKLVLRLLLPTFCCLILYIIFQNCIPDSPHITLGFCLQDTMWHGYWFTPTLFVICFVILILRFMLPKSFFLFVNILILIGLPIVMHFVGPKLGPMTNVLCIRKMMDYLPFYSLGILMSNYWDFVDKYLKKEFFRFGLLAFCVIYFVVVSVYEVVLFSYARLFFSLLVFLLFQTSAAYWSQDFRFTKICRVVGQSSLGIYLLHYFFLPHNMLFLHPYLEYNIPLQIVLGGAISIVIILLVLAVAKVLRYSRIMSMFFLGEK